MWNTLVVLALVSTVVVAKTYWCPKSGEPFECFESAPNDRFCLTNGQESKVVCSKCRRKFEWCRSGGALDDSKKPERDCGAGWNSTPCDDNNSKVPDIF